MKIHHIVCFSLLLAACAVLTACVSSTSATGTDIDTRTVMAESQAQPNSTAATLVVEAMTVFTASSDLPSEKSPVPEVIELDDLSAAIDPWNYQAMLGRGIDVDWSKTRQGRVFYNGQTTSDFVAAGIDHVRIRVSEPAEDELLEGLDAQIEDCLNNGIIPIIAYQADEFKNDPNEKGIRKVVKWWSTVAKRYQHASHLLAFDLLIEASDEVNKQPEMLNQLYEQTVSAIRESNPTRILIISPRLRSDAAYLEELSIPSRHNGYLMAQWHFYASGPSKTNERKLWTTGTEHERGLIDEKINLALAFQKKNNIPTWVGAWMAGNYNDGNDYSIDEQVAFARYMSDSLDNAKIPFAVNSDTKFYNREQNQWIKEMQPLFDCIYR